MGKSGLAAIASEINKEHGPGTVVLGSDIKHNIIPRMTSGSLALDVALGGGWPANQWNEILGNESSGKTSAIFKTIAANQRLNPDWTCVWVAAEHFVAEWAEALGVDLSRVILIEDNLMEVGYEAAIRYADSKEVDCVVVDSLPAMVPGEEAEAPMDEVHVARGARLTNQFFRKVGKAMKRSLIEEERPVLGIIINQWRDQIGGWAPRGTPQTSPGGKGKNYAYFTRVEVRRGDWIKEGKVRVGQELQFYITKNKSAAPYKSAHVDFYFEPYNGFEVGSYDVAKEVVSVALLYGILENPKQGTYVFGDQKWRGIESVKESVQQDPYLCESMEKEIRIILDRKDSPPAPEADEDERPRRRKRRVE